MDIITFNDKASSEKSARKYFLGFCWKNHQRHCPRCRERKLYKLAGGKRRCARCGYTFHDFSRRFINGCGLGFQQWLWFLKLYELNVPNREIAAQLKVTYATALKAGDILRRAVLARAVDAEQYYAGGVWPGPGTPRPAGRASKPPVFGVLDLNGYILCDLLADLDPEGLLHFKQNFRLETACIGNVVYTAPYRRYLTLVCCGKALWPTRFISHDAAGLPADSHAFWRFVKHRLREIRGVRESRFPLRLKEWELRFNNRDQSLLPVFADALCSFTPGGDFDGARNTRFPRQKDDKV